jgi:hypothetical protein
VLFVFPKRSEAAKSLPPAALADAAVSLLKTCRIGGALEKNHKVL